MFQVNDIVRYGINGVCRITEVMVRAVGKEQKEYLVLRPVHDARSTLFVPLDNGLLIGKMQQVLAKETVLELIQAMPTMQTPWIADEAGRKSYVREAMASEDRKQLVGLIQMIDNRERELHTVGKKLRYDDEKALRSAEKLLYDEFGYVLGIKHEQVLDYIKESAQ